MILKNKNEYTKQHIVPKSYLKRFAQKGESAYRIGVIQKDNRHYIDSINNVGYIKNYYDVDFLEDKKKWEHYFDDNVESLVIYQYHILFQGYIFPIQMQLFFMNRIS